MNVKAQKPEIQDLVLQKAAGFIARRGPKGWSTAELARECGLAKNTLYKIIGSKEQLFETIVLGQIDTTIELLKTIIREEKGYRSAALRMLEQGPFFLAERPRVALPEIFLEFPALEAKALSHQKRAAVEIIDFIRQGQDGGDIRSDVEPEFLYDLVRGILEHYTRSGLEGDSLIQALRKAFVCLREGVRLGDW
ncbi:MAG: TetR/AcrR family transcriptional regulator [Proteobacteria bacterium]|nr:TetR/AcrR family transcriptional regulator [Pseudomonadota bacterium]